MTKTLGAPPLRMTIQQRDELERMARSFSSPYRAVVQAKALLLAADGAANYEIARRLGVASNSVRTWRRRFEECGTSWVGTIAPGRGRRSSLPAETVTEVVRVTREEPPKDGSTRWSTRALAEHFGIGKDSVARIWRDHACKPGTS
jgi:transposase